MSKYVCVECESLYRIKKNGIEAIMMLNGVENEIWSADLWECPKCKRQLIAGFAKVPHHASFSPDFQQELERIYAKPKGYKKVIQT